MFTFLLIVQTIVAVVMITVILMQRSEGGGLASGGSPAGLMTARGAADFLTRTTAISAVIFVALSIALAALAAGERAPRQIDPSLVRQPPASAPAGPATQPAAPGAQPTAPQPPAQGNQSGVPLAQ
jgi:preprotein translocase subunit SecG